ncbi:LOW QUALITY PROTEIN: alpha glucosidase, partial [Streptomyces viridochromogenes DSM 40736]
MLSAPWDPDAFRKVISEAMQDIAGTGSTVTWVLNNHDQVRTVTRYGEPATEGSGLGAARARAAALLMLALPGAAYIYQGEELGLPEVVDLPDDVLTDPIFHRTGSRARIRDGCRVPLPWSGQASPFGFTPGAESAKPWLPQPEYFAEYATDRALADTRS